ncbi:MAG TPA: nuclear transport factor 2 family protein [Streptosporangiaceae bacterium]|nr:nuclear transport factor 2 family protein [Streptosporangiaceae bacterium]
MRTELARPHCRSGSRHDYREQYGKLFADSPDLKVTIANRMTAGDFVVDEEHLSGFHFGEMPTEMTALAVYRVADGKISKLMLLL